MESVVIDGNGGCGGRVVMDLSHIKDLVRQLEGHLGGPQTQEQCRLLASQISSLTERSISLITSYCSLDGARKRPASSPLSDASDAPFKATKKRKTTEKVKHQVRVSSAAGGDVPADDGHSWRKYGQKEILGAKHPRGYYRCTHRHSQGCAATKQVQRADEDPALFDVVYIGAHTCVQSGAAAGQAAAAAQAPEPNPGVHTLLQSLSSSLTVKTEGLAAAPKEAPQGWAAAAPFCCVSPTPASGWWPAAERSPFSAPSTSENWGASPATSDSNQHAASFLPFELVAGDAQFEFGEVVSALVGAPGEFHEDFDIASFFA
ncbi:putative WRKY transcription factor 30 [Panicum miliaceum]|uniref:WRKY transcription factor 30 n=1 Tax=Panicum miliaceum TaxID=4540 RepID=A0A3L6TEL5_PANMI|nr:putative WRKY transcription factor 30 [Panicum miliaceum]